MKAFELNKRHKNIPCHIYVIMASFEIVDHRATLKKTRKLLTAANFIFFSSLEVKWEKKENERKKKERKNLLIKKHNNFGLTGKFAHVASLFQKNENFKILFQFKKMTG